MNSRLLKVLFGVFIMFVVPVVVVSLVYLSPKTKRLDLPVLSEDSIYLQVVNDSIDFSNDIKVLFMADSSDCSLRFTQLKELSETTATYPQPRPEYKEPHPRILYMSNCEINQPFYFTIEEIKPNSDIILLDRVNQIRGEYTFTDTSITRLDIEIQHLMAETFNANKKANRRLTF